MTKILNLDTIESPADKHIVLKGEKHAFKPYTVGEFIDQTKQMEAFAKRVDVSTSEYLEHMIAMVSNAFPTLTTDVLKLLDMPTIKLITDFVKGDMQAEAVAGLESVDPEAADEAKN
jgi:hypothetical protein